MTVPVWCVRCGHAVERHNLLGCDGRKALVGTPCDCPEFVRDVPPVIDAGWPQRHARSTDPSTSHEAATPTQQTAALLAALRAVFREAGPSGLTAEEAADAAGIDGWAASKRVSDLTRSGIVGDTGQRRRGRSGRLQRVLAITPES